MFTIVVSSIDISPPKTTAAIVRRSTDSSPPEKAVWVNVPSVTAPPSGVRLR